MVLLNIYIFFLCYYFSHTLKSTICTNMATIVTSNPIFTTLKINAGINVKNNVIFLSKVGLHISCTPQPKTREVNKMIIE